jgi:hypothetical protein
MSRFSGISGALSCLQLTALCLVRATPPDPKRSNKRLLQDWDLIRERAERAARSGAMSAEEIKKLGYGGG